MHLSGKTAIVTGGGQGIGRAVALVLAKRGARVVISGRTQGKLDETVAAVSAAGGEAVALVGNVAERTTAKATVATAVEAFGGVDILVNNAQTSADGLRVTDIDDETMSQVFGSGALGTLYAMQACPPDHEAARRRLRRQLRVVDRDHR